MADTAAPGRVSGRSVRFLVWWQAFMAFFGYVVAAGVLSTWWSADVVALLLVINGGLNQATGVWLSKRLPAFGGDNQPGRTQDG